MEEMDEIVQEFLVESHENLDQLDRDLVALERDPQARELLSSVFRTIHTIKGTCGFLAFGKLEAVTHVGENLLARLRDGKMEMTPKTTDLLLAMVDTVRDLLATIEKQGDEGDADVSEVVRRISDLLEGRDPTSPSPEPVAVVQDSPTVPAAEDPQEEPGARRNVADSSIRVDVHLLDALMQLVGELVLTRNQIVRHAGDQQDVDLVRAAQRLNLIASELQEGVMKTRMQPIDHLWSKFPRIVRDLGASLDKQVRLTMVGKETELDRSLLEAVKDPLTHLVRNAIDHGLEGPDQRRAAGKPGEGVLTLRAYHEGGQVVVEVSDDGAGIDPDRITAKALERGLRTPAQLAQMSPADVLQLIFLPGFSTAASVTNVSGRGVGMDVVRTNIEGIGGTIEVESVHGAGTTCRLRIPLTLAIVPALTVECAGDRYAIPQVSLLELVALDADRASHCVEDVNGAAVYRLRGALLPLVRLAAVLGVGSARSQDSRDSVLIAVLQAEGKRFGLVIDRVLSTEEIVVKPLGPRLKAIGTYSGAAILGDGGIALILDVAALARRVMHTDSPDLEDAHETEASGTTGGLRLLVAGLGENRRVAIPLSSVTRLENFDVASVERIGAGEVVQYRGGILPLVRLEDHGPGSRDDGDRLVVIIYTVGSRSVAIVVDQIIDIADVPDELSDDVTGQGVLGTTVLDGRIVEVLDVRAAILAADPAFYADPEVRPELVEAG